MSKSPLLFLLVLFAYVAAACSPAPATSKPAAANSDAGAVETRVASNIYATLTASAPGAATTPRAAASPAAASTVPAAGTRVARASTNTPQPIALDVPTSAGTSSTGKWDLTYSKSEMDDSKIATLRLTAESPIKGWLESYTPILNLRCTGNQMDAFVQTGTPSEVEYGLWGQSTIRVRFDQEVAQTMVATQSPDNTALFFPDPVPTIAEMKLHKQMAFGFTPIRASPGVTTFDLTGLTTAIQPLEQTCGFAANVAQATPGPRSTMTPKGPATSEAGGLRMKVLGYSLPNYVKTPKPGNVFLDVEVEITNLGPDLAVVGAPQFEIHDSSGNVYGYGDGSVYAPSLDPFFGFMLSLPKGAKRTAHVGFEIPSNSSGLSIVYYVAILGDKPSYAPTMEVPLGDLPSN